MKKTNLPDMEKSQLKGNSQSIEDTFNPAVVSNSLEEIKKYISEISIAFSTGEFSKVYPHLADNVVWNVIDENEFKGKESVVKNCEEVRQYFDSVSTDFRTIHVIADQNKVVVSGTAEFIREGKSVSFVSACDVYEFNEHRKIEKITSYCIQKSR